MGNADLPPVDPVVCGQITISCIRSVALRVKGAAGPSGLEVHCWRRLCTLLAKNILYHSCRPKRHLTPAGFPFNCTKQVHWLNPLSAAVD